MLNEPLKTDATISALVDRREPDWYQCFPKSRQVFKDGLLVQDTLDRYAPLSAMLKSGVDQEALTAMISIRDDLASRMGLSGPYDCMEIAVQQASA